MSSREPRRDVRVYVGNLPPDVRTRDVEDIFVKYGRIAYIDLKAGGQRKSPFAFLEYEDPRDAEDAVKYRDGYDIDGYRLRVEFTRGVGPRGPGGRPLHGDDDRGGRGDFRRRSPKAAPSRRTGYRVLVTGLPPSGSWQDLKDHMREAGDVCYSDVFKDGTGVVEYVRYDDMKYALRKLDDTKFKSHEGEVSYVRVKEADEKDDLRSGRNGTSGRRHSRSRSPYPPRGSPQYSPRGGSRSRSRSRSY